MQVAFAVVRSFSGQSVNLRPKSSTPHPVPRHSVVHTYLFNARETKTGTTPEVDSSIHTNVYTHAYTSALHTHKYTHNKKVLLVNREKETMIVARQLTDLLQLALRNIILMLGK